MLTSNGTKRAIAHSNVSSAVHAHDKAFFENKRFNKNVKSVNVDLAVPVLKAQFEPRFFGALKEKQIPQILQTDGTWKTVFGSDYEAALESERKKRKIKVHKNGFRRRKDKNGVTYTVMRNGEPVPRTRQNKVTTATRIDTTPLPAYDTEFLMLNASDEDLAELGRVIGAEIAKKTGRKVYAVNLHADTGNLHYDVSSADRDEYGLEYETVLKYVEHLTDGREILLRYEADGYPVEQKVINEIKESMANYKIARPEFKWFYNLEVGLAADDWIRNWSKNKGLEAERLKIKDKFASVAKLALHQQSVLNYRVSEKGNAEFKAKLAEFDRKYNEQISRNNKLIAENTTLRAENKQLRAEVEALRAQNKHLQAEVDALRAHNTVTDRRFEELELRLNATLKQSEYQLDTDSIIEKLYAASGEFTTPPVKVYTKQNGLGRGPTR